MKSIKFIVGALAGATLLLTACQEELSIGEDQSRLVPEDLRYDAENSKADTLAFQWSASPTLAAGATSYSIEVCDSPDDVVNMYDDNIKTIKKSAIGKDGAAKAIFTKGISEYTEKYVRIRVNYGAAFSPWTFAANSKGEPAVFVTGHGTVDPQKPSVEKIELTDCPAGGSEISVKADLSAVSSASRVLALLIDYTSQKPIKTDVLNPSSQSKFEKTYSDLTTGKLYQVKMIAEYEGSVVSEWTVAEGDVTNDDNETVKSGVIKCGEGFVYINGVPPTVRLSAKTSGVLVFQWSESGFDNVDKDAAIPVKIALYKDAACKELVYGWTIKKYEISGRQPAMAFANLDPGTEYWFTCEDTNTGLLSDALKVRTDEFEIVTVGANKVKEGEYALSENFSELYFGGYAMEYSPYPMNNSNGQVHPQVGKWDDAELNLIDDLNHGFFNTLGKKGSVLNSRFKDWAVKHESKVGDCCIRTGMFQMGASSSMPIVFTPELTNLNGLATVTLTFSASSMWEKGAVKDTAFQSIAVYTATGGKAAQSMDDNYGTLKEATLKEVALLDRPFLNSNYKFTKGDKPKWERKSVTIKNVAPGTRIGIGAVRPEGKTGNMRWLLNMVQVKVKSYGAPTLTTPELKSQEIGKVKATFVFEPQEMAQGYRLGYKKNGEADYKYINSTAPEFNLSGLSVNTQYFIKVTAVAGSYESEKPYYQEFTTESVDYKYPMTISDNESFIDWMTYGAEFTSPSDEITLAADLDLKGVEIPAVAEFGGVFNGNGKAIRNWSSNHALFNKVTGTVKDLTIDASCVFTPASSVFAPVTLSNAGTLSNVHNKANVAISASSFDEAVNIAGIAAESTGDIKGCSNSGAISATTTSSIKGAAVAGVAGFLSGSMSGSSNTGAVTVSGKFIAGSSTIGGKSVVPCIGGLVGLGGNGSKIENSNNYGKVTFTISAMENATATQLRISVAGIVGAPEGDITNCNNYGDVYTKLATSNGAESSVNYIAIVGGISGGDFFAAGSNVTNIIDCVNEGKVTLFNDSAKANSALGGIVGWPGVENASQSVYSKNCVNKGTVTFAGKGKCRLGGVQGGSGNMEGCSNEGAIVLESGNSGSVLGGLCGFHTNGLIIKNCKALGSVTAKSTVAGIGGLIGNIGNAAHTTGEGCVVKCAITGGTEKNAGLIIGLFNGNSKAIKLGTAAAPIKVSGTINGTTVTASNYSDYLHGSTKFSASNHILTTVYGE